MTANSHLRDANTLMKLEAELLAPYAVRSLESEGREHPELPAKTRTPFQRDWHRITHCQAFRKLEFKTQVFTYSAGGEFGDVVRNRLTHTLEVSQIATSIARALGLNEDLASAIALAHDLGHPPFGHSGEEELKELVASFNHSSHSLKIVRYLEKRYPAFPGLNLTKETLEGIEKHETDFDKVKHYEFHPTEMPPLEAQVVSCADLIAYRAHDVEDGLVSEVLKYEHFERAGLKLWDRVYRTLADVDDQRVQMAQLSRGLINALIEDLTAETARRLRQNRIHSLAEVRAFSDDLVGFSHEIEQDVRGLGEVLMENFYKSPPVVRMTSRGKMILRELYHAYRNNPLLLPDEVRDSYRQAEERNEEPTRVLADYLAGMTDRYAEKEYHQLFTV
ncbi:MAG: hypothetical protein B1H03_04660 [Planctomycetales bacterium 4484_113]|nr:MAG: hypothetical protein B1H03_04660 [Planctomycetales bacterium 4484_113]